MLFLSSVLFEGVFEQGVRDESVRRTVCEARKIDPHCLACSLQTPSYSRIVRGIRWLLHAFGGGVWPELVGPPRYVGFDKGSVRREGRLELALADPAPRSGEVADYFDVQPLGSHGTFPSSIRSSRL